MTLCNLHFPTCSPIIRRYPGPDGDLRSQNDAPSIAHCNPLSRTHARTHPNALVQKATYYTQCIVSIWSNRFKNITLVKLIIRLNVRELYCRAFYYVFLWKSTQQRYISEIRRLGSVCFKKYLNCHCHKFPKSFQIYYIVLMRDVLQINALDGFFIYKRFT